MKLEKRLICFAVAALLLTVTLLFVSCSPEAVEVEAASKPCYHVTVYSPEIEKVGYAGIRKPKYTVLVDSIDELLPTPKLAVEREYQLLRIPRGDGRFDLVSTSLVEIEYY